MVIQMKDIVIIGGGAAGLTAAIFAAKKGHKVTIIERNNTCGKKILITGNGKCNFWNEDQNLTHYHSSNKEYIKNIINKETNEEILSFFKKIGIVPKIKNGYYYPYSEQSSSIKNALLTEIKNLNIEIIYNITVTEITKKDNFIINPNKENIKTKKLIIATGSNACPKTGSNGIGYTIAQKLGHQIIKPYPGLVQLKGFEPYFKKWAGVRTDAIVTLYEDGKKIKEESGQLQLTDYGLSGICIFNLSSYIARNLENHKEEISINFTPWLKENQKTWLKNQNKLVPDRTLEELLEGFLNYKLIPIILKEAGLNQNQTLDKLKDFELDKLIQKLTDFKVKITGTNTFNEAQICTGGIPLTEINSKTMESLKVKNLYFTGEILDVNGDCGGYNLSFAWTTGMLAGKNI